MKKLLLFSALTLFSIGAAAQSTTTENLKFALNNSWNCDVSAGIGTKIGYVQGWAQYILAKDVDITKVKKIKLNCSEATNVSLHITGSMKFDQKIVAGEDLIVNVADSTGKVTVEIQENTGKASGSNVATASGISVVSGLYFDDELSPIFVGSNWGGNVVQGQKSGSINYKGKWGGVDLVDVNDTPLTFDPSKNESWEIEITFAEAIDGDLLWEFAAGTATAAFYGKDHILPGDKSAKLNISPEDVDGTLSGLTLKAQEKDNFTAFTVTVRSITLKKTTTALRPVYTQADLVSTDYFSVVGVRSATPHRGINIVRRTYSDGSVVTEKTLIR